MHPRLVLAFEKRNILQVCSTSPSTFRNISTNVNILIILSYEHLTLATQLYLNIHILRSFPPLHFPHSSPLACHRVDLSFRLVLQPRILSGLPRVFRCRRHCQGSFHWLVRTSTPPIIMPFQYHVGNSPHS